MVRPREDLNKNFWKRVDKSGPCWIWKGDTLQRDDYGLFSVRHKTWRAHRLAYILTYGKIPERVNVCHHCDIP